LNPLHLGGYGVEIPATNDRNSKFLKIQDGRQPNTTPERYLFKPRQCPYDSIIIHAKTGHISLGALRWLSHFNIPVFFLDFTGATISSILPPQPVKADLRLAQFEASINQQRKRRIARAIVEGKLEHGFTVLERLAERHDLAKEIRAAKHEASKLPNAKTVVEMRTVEGHTALRYWEAINKTLPSKLEFKGRGNGTRNNYATDSVNAALNYGYGFLKVECRMAINSVGLEPAVGFLHEISRNQTNEALVYDLQEPFRFLVDLTVLETFESERLTLTDFNYNPHDFEYHIQWEGVQKLLDMLRRNFNAGVNYNGERLKWDTVIEQKALELARFLKADSTELDFTEPSAILVRSDNSVVRKKILSLSQWEASQRGIGKSTLHYLQERAGNNQPFKVYEKVREKLLLS
jgi:CRISPR-associated protein Cas1